MFPFRVVTPIRRTPLVSYSLVTLIAVIWLLPWLLLERTDHTLVASDNGIVPAALLRDPLANYKTIFTAMFLHVGFAGVAGNAAMLFTFGPAVEDLIGRVTFAVLYVGGSVAASLTQVLWEPTSVIPMIGASGGISSVLGAFFVLSPRASVSCLHLVFPLWWESGAVFQLPGYILAYFWFALELLQALATNEGSVGRATIVNAAGFIVGSFLSKSMFEGSVRAGTHPRSRW